jgi:two-component system LytT family response regulator
LFTILVCDNDSEDLQQIRVCLNRYAEENTERECAVFYQQNAIDVRDRIGRGERYDIYLLDIVMPALSGIDLAKEIRLVQPDASIIFITMSREFALDAYGLQAMSYLLKPVAYSELKRALEAAFILCEHARRSVVSIKGKDGNIRSVTAADIMYVENDRRSPVYHLVTGEKITGPLVRGTFEEAVGAVLNESAFVQPHKSFIINMKYIHSLSADMITLDDGTEVPVSQKNSASTRKSYLDYLSKLGGKD